jgi:hypothetical protein
MEATFLTTDTSFVENPPSSKISSKFQNIENFGNRQRQGWHTTSRQRWHTYTWWHNERLEGWKRNCKRSSWERSRNKSVVGEEAHGAMIPKQAIEENSVLAA